MLDFMTKTNASKIDKFLQYETPSIFFVRPTRSGHLLGKTADKRRKMKNLLGFLCSKKNGKIDTFL